MTIQITMTHNALSEDGNTVLPAGTVQNVGESHAHYLIAAGFASAPFMASNPVLARNSGDGYELVLRNGRYSQLTGGWDDLRFPAQGINPTGAASAPSVDDVLSGLPGTLLFSGSQENIIAGVAQMPHAWRAGSPIRPHIHWSKPVGSASAVEWEFYYRQLGFPSDVAGNWVGPIAGTLTAGAPETTDAHCITSFGEVSMAGKRESSMLCWQIRRQGATDADNGTARLYEFDIHYLVDKAGTASEIPAA